LVFGAGEPGEKKSRCPEGKWQEKAKAGTAAMVRERSKTITRPATRLPGVFWGQVGPKTREGESTKSTETAKKTLGGKEGPEKNLYPDPNVKEEIWAPEEEKAGVAAEAMN